jgi:hypothetical protein
MRVLPEPRRTPEFEAVAVPTAVLAVFLVLLVVVGWTLPTSGILPLSAGFVLGGFYTVVDYFTPALDMVPVSNEWLRAASAFGHILLFVLLDSLVADWLLFAFVVGLVAGVSVSRGWLFVREQNSVDGA